MAGLLYQSPIEGFGYGHQGEEIFSSRPDYDQIPYPDEDFSEESDQDEDHYDAIYGELDLQRVYGKQLVVWTHRHAETVALYTPVEGDTFVDIVKFARSTLQFNTAVDKMMVLLPGHKRPLDMDAVFQIRPGTAVLITPLYDYMVTVEVKQVGHKADMVLSIAMTVLELKGRLQTERGYPAEQTELLYRDQPLENSRYLFEYGLAHSTTIFVLLTMRHSTLVHVETFWGKRYHLHVDACTTGLEIIASVLRRTVSQSVTDVVKLYELFLPKHTLVLYLGSRLVDWDHCLGLYGVEEGSVLRMTTIGLAHEMSLQSVPVKLMDSGRSYHIQVSKFDRWSAVVLKLHGMTGYPVNLMRLIRRNNTSVDFSDTVGIIQPQTKAVRLDTSAIRADDDLVYGIPLKFKIAKGVNELLKVAPSRTIRSVKDTLERVGVPNASIIDLVYNGYRLPNNKRVVDVIDDYKTPIELSLRQYPVFIHGHNNVIYRMLAHSKETLATFLMRVAMKTGLSFQNHLLLSCGMVLQEDEETPVFDTRITPKSSIFLVPRQRYRPFLILHGDWLTKLRIPTNPSHEQIKDILWKERNVPEGGLASIGNFLQWYFGPQIRDGKFYEQATPLRERMLLYEQNVGDNVMKLRAEEPKFGRRLRRPTYGVVGIDRSGGERTEGRKLREERRKSTRTGAQKENFDTTLAELDRFAARHRRKEGRRRRQTIQNWHGEDRLPRLPRHMSAAEPTRQPDPRYNPGHNVRPRRKAYTTDPNLNANRLPALPIPYLGRGKIARRKSMEEKVDENGDNDWVFSLTHEIVENPRRPTGRRKH
ncbi:polyubiquitin-c [Plakobranchus ocellatus]|uniref:Polyubiquitin-c n=1 Tax=Plakobranchus ocellatus TaxID=259542 RepID=A0AAV4BGN1_9GAST|nr:polyubiquitin-c [Plakobranchus ocellatus]